MLHRAYYSLQPLHLSRLLKAHLQEELPLPILQAAIRYRRHPASQGSQSGAPSRKGKGEGRGANAPFALREMGSSQL